MIFSFDIPHDKTLRFIGESGLPLSGYVQKRLIEVHGNYTMESLEQRGNLVLRFSVRVERDDNHSLGIFVSALSEQLRTDILVWLGEEQQ